MVDYAGYTSWKHWDTDSFGKLSAADELYFNKEIFSIKKNIGSVLEIGFGNGNFYAWCKKQDIRYVGTEIITGLIETARTKNMEAYDDISKVKGSFDMIVAFDVFEHISSDDLLVMLKKLRSLLSKGGVIVARFPNGDSFLSMECQNGDYTHISYIGSGKMRVLAELAGLRLTAYRPLALPIVDISFLKTAKNILAFIIRGVIENFLSLLMYKRFGKTMSANAISILAPTD